MGVVTVARLAIADPPYLNRGERWYGSGNGDWSGNGTADVHPDVVTLRHYYWVSAAPLLMSHAHTGVPIANEGRADEMAAAYGLPPIPVGAVKDRRLAIRNAVVPIEGYDMAVAAFARELAQCRGSGSGDPS